MPSKHVRRELASRTRRRQVIFAAIAILVIVAIILAFALQGGNGGGGPDGDDGDGGGTRTIPIAGSGDDAGVTFDLLTLTCGFESVSGAGARYTPAGEYCLADLTITAERDLELDVSCQFLVVGEDKVAAAAEPTLFLIQDGAGALMAGPEPLQASLVFDVAKEAAVSAVELHGACDAPGVVLSA